MVCKLVPKQNDYISWTSVSAVFDSVEFLLLKVGFNMFFLGQWTYGTTLGPPYAISHHISETPQIQFFLKFCIMLEKPLFAWVILKAPYGPQRLKTGNV